MAHSKRNTSLPHFTSYERSLLRNAWGTKRSVIGRDSFLPFASCKLCLQPARSPVVSCATSGDLFCRECAINDLLAQRQEIKRLERERDDAKKRIAEDDKRTLDEARRKELEEFELVSMGLEAGKKRRAAEEDGGSLNSKRQKAFERDEEERRRGVEAEGERLRDELKKEKVCFCELVGYGICADLMCRLSLASLLFLLFGFHLLRPVRMRMRLRPIRL